MIDASGHASAYLPPAGHPAVLPQSVFDRNPYL